MTVEIALFWCVFLIVNICHDVAGNTNLRTNKFTEDSKLNGFECGDGFTIDVTNDFVAESVPKCAQMCAVYSDCVGFYYKTDWNTTCILCNVLFNPAGTGSLTPMAGSRYFSRSECHGWIRGNPNLKVFLEEVSHSDAHARCEENNATLVKIKDQTQLIPISDALASCPSYNTNTDYWTDGVKDGATGIWTYADDSVMPMESPEFWENGSPDGHSTEHCTRLRYDASNDRYRWNDKNCETLYRFICEYNK